MLCAGDVHLESESGRHGVAKSSAASTINFPDPHLTLPQLVRQYVTRSTSGRYAAWSAAPATAWCGPANALIRCLRHKITIPSQLGLLPSYAELAKSPSVELFAVLKPGLPFPDSDQQYVFADNGNGRCVLQNHYEQPTSSCGIQVAQRVSPTAATSPSVAELRTRIFFASRPDA
jgi:hypothetical protein